MNMHAQPIAQALDQFDRGVQVGVSRTLGTIMRAMLAARQECICGYCRQTLPEFDYLPDEMIQTPPISREEKKRREDRERRVDIILRGGMPS